MSRIPVNKITPPDPALIRRTHLEENHSIEECCSIFGVCGSTFKSWLRFYGIKKERALVLSKIQQTNQTRYGGVSPTCSKEVSGKVRDTMMSRYGSPTPLQNPDLLKKARNTLRSRYGVNSTWDIPEVRARQKEIMEKRQKTTMLRYGSNWYTNSEEYKSRVPELVRKAQQTHIERYGVPVYSMSEDFRQKLPEIQERKEQTNLSRYGERNYSQTEEFRHKAGLKYWFDGESFDSSWELALWIYAKDHGEDIVRSPCRYSYEYQGKVHFYFPDFLYRGQVLEIKGDYFFDGEGKMISPFADQESGIFEAKQRCMAENGVIVWSKKEVQYALDYVSTNYGKNYLKKFKR